jgi:hypothetical protein
VGLEVATPVTKTWEFIALSLDTILIVALFKPIELGLNVNLTKQAPPGGTVTQECESKN